MSKNEIDTSNVFPEIAARGAGKFNVAEPDAKQGGGSTLFPTGKSKGQFNVPLGQDAASLAIRTHEYGHLGLQAWGRVTHQHLNALTEAGDFLLANSILDVLVNEHLKRNGLGEDISHLPFPNFCNIRNIDYTTYLRGLDITDKRLKPLILSNEDKNFLKAIKDELCELLNVAGEIPVDKLVDISKRLSDRFGLSNMTPPRPQEGEGDDEQAGGEGDGESGEGEPGEDESKEGSDSSESSSEGTPKPGAAKPKEEDKKDKPKPTETKKKEPPKPKPIPKSIRDEMAGKAPIYTTPKKKTAPKYKAPVESKPFDIGGATGRDGEWGQLYIDYHKLEKTVLNSEKNARKARPGFTGAFRYPVRALLPAFDGSCFGAPQRSKGGTMLVDLSGSMSITDEQIQELVRKAPHIKIAMYCGGRNDPGITVDEVYRRGTLVVLAARGRMVEDVAVTRTGGANIVDGPALEWLAKQPTPRIWICDGQVTGVHECQNSNLTRWALNIKRFGRIKQYKSIEAFQDKEMVPSDRLR